MSVAAHELSADGSPAVVLLVFNRPEHTRRMLAALREVRPARIFIVADGPRPGMADDPARCAEVRRLLETGIDWPADVQRDFAGENMGLRQRVASGLDWAFSQVGEAIVLEDDCVADPSFFRYCAELLDRYRDEPRVGAITGDNFQPAGFAPGASYYFSRYPHCWGWATWRRAWNCYDDAMVRWPELRDRGWLAELFTVPGEANYWREIFDQTWSRSRNSWASAWTFACWSNSLLTAIPRVNLVENIGFDAEGTHTKADAPWRGRFAARSLEFPLRAPAVIARDLDADDYTQRYIFERVRRRAFPFLEWFSLRRLLPRR